MERRRSHISVLPSSIRRDMAKMVEHPLHRHRSVAAQDTYSIHYFHKVWSLTNDGDLGRKDARKIVETGMLWLGSRICLPIAVSQSPLDRPAPSRPDLSLSRDFIQTKK
jgi:hypothetical protein